MTSKINIFGGRYGLGSKEFKPRDVKAIAEGMMRGTLRHNFTVGITDDVTGLSLPTDAAFGIEDITPALAAGAARNFAGRGVGLISQNNQIDSDDLTNEPIPRPSQESARATPAARAGVEQRKSAILYGIGSDGTVSAVKNIVKIVGENSKLYPQSYAVYDSKKSGGLTASHLRFAPKPIRSQYLVEYADFIGVSSFMIAQRFDVFKGLKPGGTVMINTSRSPNDAFSNLPRAVQEHLIRMRARVFFLDANRGAEELGLGRRINTFIMLNFFNLTHVIDPKIVAARAKEAIEKTYKKKGEAVIAANWAAVDRAADFLHEYTLPSSPSGFAPDWTPAMTPDAPARIAGVLGEMAAMRGDDLPVSVFVPSRLTPVGGEWPRSGRGGASSNKNSLSEVAPPSPPSLSLRRDSPPQEGGHATEPSFAYGEYPVGTSKYEKRAISERVASVDLNICIQCGKCSMLCPHAAILQSAATRDQAAASADVINFVDMKTPELGADMMWSLNISPADCTGCQVCTKVCPVRALKMVPIADAIASGNQTAFDAAGKLPSFPHEKLNLNLPKHIELCDHMFEFSGACGGCGETPYIKLVTQLFGDRMIIANATGCSSIYGANLPTTPYTTNKAGQGPAWSNSLFEDNAEYGLGMRLALNQRQNALRGLLFELQNGGAIPADIDVEKLFDEKDINKQRANVEMLKGILLGSDGSVASPPSWGGVSPEGRRGGASSEFNNISSTIESPPSAATPPLPPKRGETRPHSGETCRIAETLSLLDALVDKSVWIIGGDGWAYDIGYGGLDHVLHSGQNVNILVLDTEGYSNTGGQQSKATPFGASMKFAVGGKDQHKKDLGLIAMMSGAYVAQIAMGADQIQAIKAIREAEAFPGPSIILAYSPCISHGYDMQNGPAHQRMLVDSGVWPLFRFNPELIEQGKNPLILDSGADIRETESENPELAALEKFLATESRFSAAQAMNPTRFARLTERAASDNEYRRELKKHIASFALLRKTAKSLQG